jgi:putative tricarboxylic transport membrane protein
MLDRIFAGAILMIAAGYTILAFTIVKAPFQYDPLGPETWPRILGILAIICCAILLIKPDNNLRLASKNTLIRLAILVALLSGYAMTFKPLGFIISTLAFCAIMAKFLGAKPTASIIFALIASIGGYVLCAIILDLNLPSGLLAAFY